MPRYARDAIPEVWLIDIEHQTVTQYLHPSIVGYRHHVTLARGQMLIAQTIPGIELTIDAIFG